MFGLAKLMAAVVVGWSVHHFDPETEISQQLFERLPFNFRSDGNDSQTVNHNDIFCSATMRLTCVILMNILLCYEYLVGLQCITEPTVQILFTQKI